MSDATITLTGYQMTEKIHDSLNTVVYRGQRLSDRQAVVIKILKSEYPSFLLLVQFRHQYTITKNLEIPGVIQPLALENYRNGYALVMKDWGDISLADYIANQAIALDQFFNIGIQIAQILANLYEYRIIHKDIKPQNLLIHPVTKAVKLIDFSNCFFTAQRKARETPTSPRRNSCLYVLRTNGTNESRHRLPHRLLLARGNFLRTVNRATAFSDKRSAGTGSLSSGASTHFPSSTESANSPDSFPIW